MITKIKASLSALYKEDRYFILMMIFTFFFTWYMEKINMLEKEYFIVFWLWTFPIVGICIDKLIRYIREIDTFDFRDIEIIYFYVLICRFLWLTYRFIKIESISNAIYIIYHKLNNYGYWKGDKKFYLYSEKPEKPDWAALLS